MNRAKKFLNKSIEIWVISFVLTCVITQSIIFLIAYINPYMNILVSINKYNEAFPELIYLIVSWILLLIYIYNNIGYNNE